MNDFKIYAIFGPSGSGKTYHIEETIIRNLPIEEKKLYDVDVTSNEEEGLLLFGKYLIENRCKGCDTLSMSIITPLINCLQQVILDGNYRTIVVDGDRVNNDKMFRFLNKYKENVEVVFIDTPLDVIFKRLPNCNRQFVKTTFTKTKHTINKALAYGLSIKHVKVEKKPFFSRR